jgi:hypothetical protein
MYRFASWIGDDCIEASKMPIYVDVEEYEYTPPID